MINPNGEVDTSSDQARQWKGAIERYELQGKEGRTILQIKADSQELMDHFEKAWPAALSIVKELSEKEHNDLK